MKDAGSFHTPGCPHPSRGCGVGAGKGGVFMVAVTLAGRGGCWWDTDALLGLVQMLEVVLGQASAGCLGSPLT